MKALLIGSAVVLALLLLDRLLLGMEARGWIYYRRRKPNPGAVGSALLEIQKYLEPSKKYVIEMREEKKAEEDDEAGRDRPGRENQG